VTCCSPVCRAIFRLIFRQWSVQLITLSIYSTQRGFLTWKKKYSHCLMQQFKTSHLHVWDLKSWLRCWWKFKSCKKNVALCCCSEDLITQQHNVIYQKTNFLLHIRYRSTTSSDLKSIMFLIDVYVYSASVNVFTLLVWWMYVYEFAAVTTKHSKDIIVPVRAKLWSQ
jgi:hypothetical protein